MNHESVINGSMEEESCNDDANSDCYCVRPRLAWSVFIKHPLETSLSLSLLDIIMSSLILNGILLSFL